MNEFKYGLRRGTAVGMGYFPVSFTFGLLAVTSGLSPLTAVAISMTNLTSAGQFAGIRLIGSQATYLEMSAAMFVINIRYALMGLSLSQKLDEEISKLERAIMSFGITDEIFAIASLEDKKISFQYMMGLVSMPYIGWSVGTLIGAATGAFIPETLQNAMGIALYGMFIAIIVPASKKSMPALAVIGVAVFISSLFYWNTAFSFLSQGWSMIISAVLASLAGALIFPKGEEGN
jgi:predicted branched-subunit amino acid permease